jgi:hypothetical protein
MIQKKLLRKDKEASIIRMLRKRESSSQIKIKMMKRCHTQINKTAEKPSKKLEVLLAMLQEDNLLF